MINTAHKLLNAEINLQLMSCQLTPTTVIASLPSFSDPVMKLSQLSIQSKL